MAVLRLQWLEATAATPFSISDVMETRLNEYEPALMSFEMFCYHFQIQQHRKRTKKRKLTTSTTE